MSQNIPINPDTNIRYLGEKQHIYKKHKILTESLEYFKNPLNETNARNNILTLEFKKLPSYTIWREEDIVKASLETRISWYQEHLDNSHPKIKEIALDWYNYLQYLHELSEINSKRSLTNTPNNSPNLEFCSKRFTNELYCDI